MFSSKTVQDTKTKTRRDTEFSTFSFINKHSYFFDPDVKGSEPEGSSTHMGNADKGAVIVVDGRPSTQRSGSTSSGSSELQLPKIYYRLYSADQGAIFTQTPLDTNDPSLSFILADWAPPPYTVRNLKRYICNREQFHPSRASLYLSRRDPLPALGYARVDLLSSTLRPGSTPEKAIAIVIQLDEEGLGTARNPLPIARRCKKGMEEMVRAIKTFMDATVHKKVILGARIRKLKEPETRAEGKRTAQGEETSEREPAKYEQAPRSEQREQEKELPRVSELEDATERREMQEREVVADTHAAEATRGHTPASTSSHLSSKTYDPEASYECGGLGFRDVEGRTTKAYHC